MTDQNQRQQVNAAGLSRADYRGAPSTLCQGCGHNGIASQIVAACYELDIVPEQVVKFSGIGCSSKSPTYFLSRSFGFNGLHGRMPSLALGALFADTSLKGIGVSGDGDTASIGMGQFKHLVRRNLPMVYLVENNGVYGLTKGQFSATAERGLELKRQGINPFLPVDICLEALVANATFVARSFAGDPKQLKELLKAAFSHNGIAVLDIISPCVTFHNKENTLHSYTYGKEHEEPLHEIAYVPARDDITVEDFEEGSSREVTLHDGSIIVLKKLNQDYDPTNKAAAYALLEESHRNQELITGLIYVDPAVPSMFDAYHLPETALNRLPEKDLRPTRQSLEEINQSLI
ncbi:MAG TPA: 2-oxoacid:ferredoxin oxidoreductase subunit beta [Anaerolineaceae bacterium]|nr:2-oxoacid:ferredoxin oxidoreductase subunit beta [Anaerolineaceae bacterium]HQF45967.1 2-oxoacid:ferredoxin oxidoreductase subunit beta [Anaerolineaceae bacterium]HQH35536.1 2-oxoacid:ferredoxin oxidoreductase subunit beta [Anaerolineaceae bacterium]HQJ03379.1 2-oxoacid:ferredoxin oxidoreductase subunit beta [Anaerolineaceae bacterium]HQP59805.1 2-oxoacid:ferredoxin oxidoreductase subunit beta [Anaerolineaceae bacterium]